MSRREKISDLLSGENPNLWTEIIEISKHDVSVKKSLYGV
jgi:hypothetical protein